MSAGQPGQPPDAQRDGAAAPPGSGGLAVLLGRVSRGDEAAFGAVYDQVAGQVFGIARSVPRDPSQAEEVTQEVLLDVWRHAARYDTSRGTATAWVMTRLTGGRWTGCGPSRRPCCVSSVPPGPTSITTWWRTRSPAAGRGAGAPLPGLAH